MKIRTRFLVAGVVGSLAIPFALHAAEPQRCNDLFDDAQRLACYDAAFGKPTHTAAAANAPVAPMAPAAAAATATVATAAATAPAAAKTGTTSGSAPALPQTFKSPVTALGKSADGRFIATLENGQQWLQLEHDSRVELKVGESVTLNKMVMGNYEMTTHTGYTLRVKRLQ
jgi:hypothetical protein